MSLKCKIKNKIYRVTEGVNISEEFNETLDSGSIIIPHVEPIEDLAPYDDVYIYDGPDEFIGYNASQKILKELSFSKTLIEDGNKIFKFSAEYSGSTQITKTESVIIEYTLDDNTKMSFDYVIYYDSKKLVPKNEKIQEIGYDFVEKDGKTFLEFSINGMLNIKNENSIISYLCQNIDVKEFKFVNIFKTEQTGTKEFYPKVDKNLVTFESEGINSFLTSFDGFMFAEGNFVIPEENKEDKLRELANIIIKNHYISFNVKYLDKSIQGEETTKDIKYVMNTTYSYQNYPYITFMDDFENPQYPIIKLHLKNDGDFYSLAGYFVIDKYHDENSQKINFESFSNDNLSNLHIEKQNNYTQRDYYYNTNYAVLGLLADNDPQTKIDNKKFILPTTTTSENIFSNLPINTSKFYFSREEHVEYACGVVEYSLNDGTYDLVPVEIDCFTENGVYTIKSEPFSNGEIKGLLYQNGSDLIADFSETTGDFNEIKLIRLYMPYDFSDENGDMMSVFKEYNDLKIFSGAIDGINGHNVYAFDINLNLPENVDFARDLYNDPNKNILKIESGEYTDYVLYEYNMYTFDDDKATLKFESKEKIGDEWDIFYGEVKDNKIKIVTNFKINNTIDLNKLELYFEEQKNLSFIKDINFSSTTKYNSDEEIYDISVLEKSDIVVSSYGQKYNYKFEKIILDNKELYFLREPFLNKIITFYLFNNNIHFYYNGDLTIKKWSYNISDDTVYPQYKFYKHLLVDKFSEEIVNLKDNICKYKIELFSETKRLETIPLPNISITQPIDTKKRKTVWFYLEQYVNYYSPNIKVAVNDEVWRYVKKYTLDPKLKDVFDNVMAPEMSLNSPTLRELLSRLMIVKDMIPVVKDNLITGMDISKRNGPFDTKGCSYVSSSLSSENYYDNLRTSYSNALAEDKSCRYVEYLGFRNSNDPLLTLENMRVETSFPIYKINKMYMCYFKRVKIFTPENGDAGERYFLCKQDITPLVLLNSYRNLLSKDWDDLNLSYDYPKNINEMAQYKMCTVGYDIGSNFITGWGTKYQYPIAFWSNTATYIENIYEKLDAWYPFGIDGEEKLQINGKDFQLYEYRSVLNYDKLEGLVTPFERFVSSIVNEGTIVSDFFDWVFDQVEGTPPSSFKGIFFQVDYNGFFNGTLVHTKDDFLGNISSIDNPSSALTLLEKDGFFQKEKLNRFGNKGYVIPARYNDISELQELGSVATIKKDDDIIIYHREYNIFNNVINCVYYGIKDYVLKNYFTTVFAKHRPFNLMSYNESTSRAENKKVFVTLSKNKQKYEILDNVLGFNKFENNVEIQSILSFFKNTKREKKVDDSEEKIFFNKPVFDKKINYGFISYNGKKYATDINTFISGCSLCFNLRMKDNVSSGVYIKHHEPVQSNLKNWLGNERTDRFIANRLIENYELLKGSTEDFYSLIDDVETGKTNKLGFYVSHAEPKENEVLDVLYNGKVLDSTKEEDLYVIRLLENEKKGNDLEGPYKVLFNMPYISDSLYDFTNIIGNEFELFKDNKEIIDMTFQIEVLSEDKDIFFSEWVLRLSDLFGMYDKAQNNTTLLEPETEATLYYTTAALNPLIYDDMYVADFSNFSLLRPLMVLYFSKNIFDYILQKENDEKEIKLEPYKVTYLNDKGRNIHGFTHIKKYAFTFKNIDRIGRDENGNITYLAVKGEEELYIHFMPDYKYAKNITVKQDKIIYFYLTDNLAGNKLSENGYYFTNTNYTDDGNFDDNLNFTKLNPTIIGENFNVKVEPFSAIPYWYGDAVNEYKEYNDGVFMASNVQNAYQVNDYFVYNSSLNKKCVKQYSLKLYSEKLYNNLFVCVTEGKQNKNIAYTTKTLEQGLDGIIDKDISELIYFDNQNKLIINLKDLELTSTDKHLSVWFKDNNLIHYVFGVNISEEDIQKGEIEIYCSLLSDREEKVYNYRNEIVGTVENYADSEKKYNEEQYYTKKQ